MRDSLSKDHDNMTDSLTNNCKPHIIECSAEPAA